MDRNIKKFLFDISTARNLIIHGYGNIDNTEIWSMIINNLPVLKREIELLLETTTT